MKKESPEEKLKKEADSIVVWADGTLAKFIGKLADHPAHAMEWGGDTVNATAQREVALIVLSHLEGKRTADQIMQTCVDQTVGLAESANNRSTSAMHNLMSDHRLAAWAKFARFCRDISRGFR